MDSEILICQNRRREFLTDLKSVMDKHKASIACEIQEFGSAVEMTYDLSDDDYPQSYVYLSESCGVAELDSDDLEALIGRESTQ